MVRRAQLLSAATRPAVARRLCTILLAVALFGDPQRSFAQGHDHGGEPPTRDARLELMLGGPHVLLYHRGYLALGEAQVDGLQPLRRAVCEAEQLYVERVESWRARLDDLLSDSVMLPPTDTSPASPLHHAMAELARAESEWLTALLHARRDAVALLTASQRVQAQALRDHWVRESMAMIDEATRPGQRGHPGTQLPIRVPAMVVGATALLPYCEVLHGPSSHISMPPPR